VVESHYGSGDGRLIPEERIRLRPTRRFLLAQRINHAVPAVTLLLAAVEGLGGGPHKSVWLIALDVIAGGGLLLVLIREMRSTGEAPHARASIIELLAAVVVFLEGVHRYNPQKGFQPAWMYFVMAVATLVIGLLHHRIAAMVQAVFTSEGFAIKTRPIRSLRMDWREVAALERQGDSLVVRATSGRTRRINLRTCANRDEVFAAFGRRLDAYRSAAAPGVEGEPPASLPPAERPI
jgi:hypothetical protein